MSTFLTLQTVEALLEHLNDLPPVEAETISLSQGLGRTLAQPLLARENLPGFDRSTVDGFAVQARDVFGATEGAPALLDVLGECLMGQVPDLVIGPGQTARIWTGGMLPQGADAVVMLEYARSAGSGRIELTRPVAPRDNVILKDEDAAQGQELLPQGRQLTPQDLGVLAALGQESLTVRRKPRIAIISSGDEVVPVSASPRPGQIRESNSHTLSALITQSGGEPVNLGLVSDDLEELIARVRQGLESADAVVVTGGSSAGQRDFTRTAFESLPGWSLLAHGVAMRPGKPTILARNGRQTLWGLPGNPTAAFITAQVFIRPLVAALLGQSPSPAPKGLLKARLSRRVASAQGRRDYIRVLLEPGETEEDFPVARPLLGPSGLVSNPSGADGLVICHESQEGLDAGQVLTVQLLHWV